MFKIFCFSLFSSLLSNSVIANQFNYSVKKQEEFIVLSNGKTLEIAIAPERGGELTSLKVNYLAKWHELIYRAKDYNEQKGWRGKAPLLWPATGISKVNNVAMQANKLGQYKLNDKLYAMPFHGFAKTMLWTLDDISADQHHAQATLSINNNIYSQEFYPFAFKLSVTYRVSKEQLSIKYKVHANSHNQGEMPFSIGNHITFKAPLIDSSNISEFKFITNSNQQLERIKGLPTGKIMTSPFIGLTKLSDLPEKKSISLLSGEKQASFTMIDESGLQVKLSHRASSLPEKLYLDFNLWASAKEGFISPEPWLGSQNSLNSTLGLIQLKPNEYWQWNIDINFNN